MTTGCEGRCGVRLDDDGREVRPPPLVFDHNRPRHTPDRCRAIRALREAVEAACPGWDVEVGPDAVVVFAEGRDSNTLSVVVTRRGEVTRDYLALAVYDAVRWASSPGGLEANAASFARYVAGRLATGIRSVNGTG